MIKNASIVVIPLIIFITIIFAIRKKINTYDSFLSGVKDGMSLFKEVFPTLVAMVFVVSLLRSSGLIKDIGEIISILFNINGEFSEMIPMIAFRPISGSASISVFNSICKESGPDSFLCKTSAVIQGSTDTTLYVLSLYFSSIGITKWKHSLKVGLIADVAGIGIGLILSFIFLQ